MGVIDYTQGLFSDETLKESLSLSSKFILKETQIEMLSSVVQKHSSEVAERV